MLRRTLPFLRVKKYYSPKDIEFSDDSDEGEHKGPLGSPFDPQPPGIKMKFMDIPVSLFYEFTDKEKPRNAQPSYIRYPVDTQLWHIFNANALPLGRIASRAAQYLTGKHKPFFTHHALTPKENADFVVVVNGKLPLLRGPKGKSKLYRSHSTYPGGLQEHDVRYVLSNHHWDKVVKRAVSGMLPKNLLRKPYLERLFIFPELYHNFDFLPQFQYRDGVDHNKELGFTDLFNSPDSKIIYKSCEELPDELKHLPYEPEDIESPPGLRDEPYPRDYTSGEKRKIRRYYKKLRRYRTFNYATKKFELR